MTKKIHNPNRDNSNKQRSVRESPATLNAWRTWCEGRTMEVEHAGAYYLWQRTPAEIREEAKLAATGIAAADRRLAAYLAAIRRAVAQVMQESPISPGDTTLGEIAVRDGANPAGPPAGTKATQPTKSQRSGTG